MDLYKFYLSNFKKKIKKINGKKMFSKQVFYLLFFNKKMNRKLKIKNQKQKTESVIKRL